MTTYLRSWFATGPSASETTNNSYDSEFTAPTISPPSDEEDGSDTEIEHDDSPSAFPSLSSAQRLQSLVPTILTDAQRMPPPPLPRMAQHNPGITSSLAVPLTTTKRPPKKRDKVSLAPGHSPLDWASLKASGRDLRVCVLCHVIPSLHSWLSGS